MLNVFLGASTFSLIDDPGDALLGFPLIVVWVAIVMGIICSGSHVAGPQGSDQSTKIEILCPWPGS